MELIFDAEVKDGTITLPANIKGHIADHAKVHVHLQVESEVQGADAIQELLDHPIEINDFKPMTREEIYDRSKP